MLRNEAALQRAALKLLNDELPGVWEIRAPGYYTAKGVLDAQGCYFGHYVALEFKHPRDGVRGDVTDEQWKYGRRIFQAGGSVLFTNNLQAVARFARRLKCGERTLWMENWEK